LPGGLPHEFGQARHSAGCLDDGCSQPIFGCLSAGFETGSLLSRYLLAANANDIAAVAMVTGMIGAGMGSHGDVLALVELAAALSEYVGSW